MLLHKLSFYHRWLHRIRNTIGFRCMVCEKHVVQGFAVLRLVLLLHLFQLKYKHVTTIIIQVCLPLYLIYFNVFVLTLKLIEQDT